MRKKIENILRRLLAYVSRQPSDLEVLSLMARAVEILQDDGTLSTESETLNTFRVSFLNREDKRTKLEIKLQAKEIHVYPEIAVYYMSLFKFRGLKNVDKLMNLLNR